MPETILYQPAIDNSQLAAGLSQMEAMVDAKVKSIQAKMASSGGGKGIVSSFAGASPQLQALESQINRVDKSTQGFGRSLDRVAGVLNGGLGIGIAVGGLALLEKSFDKAITKAKQFEVAQLAIAASIASAYKLQGPGGNIEGGAAFSKAMGDAQKLNKTIIDRQAKNILTYQEQLGAFQSSLNAGARKGLSPTQTLDVSEQLAIVAKTLGLRGEEIANASRIALGGATNVSRSTIGRALGISNEDIQKRQGVDLQKFLLDKTKGFQAAGPSFAKSIEGVLSTLEAKIDVFASKVGEKFMKKATPIIETFGAAFESGDADKIANTLADLFGAALKAIETLAHSPAIPLIIKFLEFLSNFGDKLLIVGALSKMASVLGGVASGFNNFIGTLKGVASEAANAAGSIDSLAAAETRAMTAARGTGGGAGIGSRGRAASEPEAGLGGRNLARAENAALYEQALGSVGTFDMQRPGTGGKTNLKGYASKYAAAKAAHNEAIGGRVRDIKGKQLRQQVRGRLDESFENFTGMQGFQANTENIEGGIARGELAESQNSEAAARKARFGKSALIGLDNAQRFAGGAALGFFGSELVKNQTDQSGNANVRGFGGALQGTATVGGGLAAAGGLFNPIGIAVTALVGTLEGLHSALDTFQSEMDKANSSLEEFDKANPLAAKVRTLTEQRNGLGKSVRTQNTSSVWDNFLTGVGQTGYNLATGGSDLNDYQGDTYTKNILGDRTVKGRKEALDQQIQEAKDAQRSKFIRDTSEQELTSNVKNDQAAQKSLALGYGGKNALANLAQQSKTDDHEISLAAVKGELVVSDEIKKSAAGIFAQYEASRQKFIAQRNADRRAGKAPADMPAYLSTYTSQSEVEQDLAKADLSGQNKQRYDDQLRGRDLTRQSLAAGNNYDKISGARDKGRADLDKDLIGKRGDFEDIGEYEKFAATSRKKFEHDFNEPLKRLEAQLQGLNLGVNSQNVAEAADLAFKVTDKKLQEMVDAFEISAAQAGKLRIQAKAARDAAILKDNFEQANQSFGRGDRAQILGRAQSEITTKALNQRADMAGAQGDPLREAYYKKLTEIEGKRGVFNPAQFEEFRKSSLETFKQQMALQAIGGGGLTSSQQLSKGVRDAALNMETLEKELRQSGQNRGLDLQNRPVEDALRTFQNKQEDRGFSRLKEDQGNRLAESRIGLSEAGLGVRSATLGIAQSGLNVQSADLNARKADLAPVLDTGGGPYSAAASAIQYKVQAEQGFDPKAYENALRESVQIKKEEAQIARQNAALQKQFAGIEQEASSLKLQAAQITYDRAAKADSHVDEDYQTAVQQYALRLTERANNEDRIATQRAQADENYVLAQEKLRNQISDLAAGMEKAKQILLGNLDSGKAPTGGITGNLSNVKTLSITLSPTINSNIQVDASATLVDVPDSEIDKITSKVASKIKQDIQRACQRS